MPTQVDDAALYARMDPLLGTRPDPEVAESLGAPVTQVKARRKSLGIAPFLRVPPKFASPPAEEAAPTSPTGSVVVRRRSNGADRTEARIRTSPAADPLLPVPAPPQPNQATARRSSSTRSALDAWAHLVGVERDGVVAGMAGVSRSAVAQYRHRHGIAAGVTKGGRPKETPASPKPSVEATSPTASTPTAPRRRKTRLEGYLHLLGVRPDSEVAELAGVRRENVRAFRRRHGISDPVAQTSSVEAATPVAAAPPTPPENAREKGRPGRKSPLEAHLGELGAVPDAVLAVRAGVSVATVALHRKRRGIAAYVSQGTVTLARTEPALTAPVTPTPKGAPIEADASAVLQVYRVVATKGEDRLLLYVVAADILRAVERTVRALEARGDGAWVMRRVRWVGEGLGR